MLEYVPIKEFQQFLLKHGVVWDGKVFEEKNGKYQKVDMKTSDYGYSYRGGLSINAKIPHNTDNSFEMFVDETQLLLYGHVGNVFDDLEISLDLSREWRNHLIENHIWQYGPIIRDYALEQIEKVKKGADWEISSLNKKKKQIEERIQKAENKKNKQISEWKDIIKKTKTKYSNM